MPRFLHKPETYYTQIAPIKINDLTPSGNGQLRGTCPFCKKPDRKFYIEQTSGLFICQQCRQSGGRLKYHSLTKPCSLEEAAKEICYQEQQSTQSYNSETLFIPSSEVEKYQASLQRNPGIIEALKENWHITDECITTFKLGWLDGAVTIPIYDSSNHCCNIRFKRLFVPPDYDGSKIWNYKDPSKPGYSFGSPTLFPTSNLIHDELFVVAGEKDLLSSWSVGLRNVITGTGGEGYWNDEWIFDVQGKTVYIVYDIDDPGLEYAKKLYEKLKQVCKCFVITLPKMPDYESGKKRKDITDFWKLGKSLEDFIRLIPSTTYYVNSNGKHPVIYNRPLPQVFNDKDEEYLDKVGDKTLIDDYIEYGRIRVNSPRSFHRLSALWVISNILGRRCVSVLNGPVYANLWTILVGPTTSVHKSSTTDLAVDLLKQIYPPAIAMGAFTPEGALASLSRRENELTSAIYYDEIGMLFEQIKSKDYMAYARDMLIKMFNTQPIIYDRSKDRIVVERHYVTLIGSAVAKRMAELLTWKDVESGLLIRFLMALEPEGEDFRPQEYLKPDDDFLHRKLLYLLFKVKERWEVPWEIPLEENESIKPPENNPDAAQYNFMFSGIALERYNEFTKTCFTAKECEESEAVGLVHARMPMFLQKLSIIYAAIDPKTRVFYNNAEINLRHVLLAIRDLDQFRRHMVSLVLTIGSSELEHLVSETYHFIYSHKRTTRRDIAANLKTTKKTLDDVLATMSDRGMIVGRRLGGEMYEYMVTVN